MKPNKYKAIIVDIDGTLANNDHRQHFLRGDVKDWKSFSESCTGDHINEWCGRLVQGMSRHYEIIFVSGRTEEYREVTEDLINVVTTAYHLYMRADGDFRPDTEIKEEIYNNHIRETHDVLFCVDDRPVVCRMWRSLGLTVLQCNDNEF